MFLFSVTKKLCWELHFVRFPYGLVVRIPAFHVGGPGSIPGVGTSFLINNNYYDV